MKNNTAYFNTKKPFQDLKDELSNTTGDVLLAAASVAYLGAFTSTYRKELVNFWIEKCMELQIPASNNFW